MSPVASVRELVARSRGPPRDAVAATTDELEHMLHDLEAGLPRESVDLALHAGGLQGLNSPTGDASQVVVVMLIRAHRVQVSAIFVIDAVEQPQLGEELEGPKNRGPTDGHAAVVDLVHDLLGTEGVHTGCDVADDGLPGASHPSALVGQLVEDRAGPLG